MYDHGNYDYDTGWIRSPNILSYDYRNKSSIEKQKIDALRKKYNKGRTYRVKPQVPYCTLFSRNHGGYGKMFKQHYKSETRRHCRSSANKRTRQRLKIEMNKELNDL